jgi:hypothetical protein
VRTTFVVYDYLMHASAVIGYLESLGRLLGCSVIEVDREGLSRAWSELNERLLARTSGVDWRALRIDYRQVHSALDEPQPLLGEVRAALRRYAPPPTAPPPDDARAVLERGLAEQVTDYLARMEQIRGIWAMLGNGAGRSPDEPLTPEILDYHLRAAGLTFKVACAVVEYTMMLDRYRTAQRAGRARTAQRAGRAGRAGR